LLTFLAGSEIDPQFASVWLFTQFALGWSVHQAQIAGIALSTTSVAVVYSVMIERGLSDTPVGKLILAACLGRRFHENKALANRIRTTAFMVFTPFYFIKAGLYISLKALVTSLGVIATLFLIKVFFKTLGVWPVSRAIRLNVKMSNYTTLLMSTGLTFGSIAALYGLNNHIIGQNQYTILVTVVILSAIIPTLIAQKFFEPSLQKMLISSS